MPGNSRLWGFNVSEGGLEPPCPFGALAPKASASAYSATRTSACHGWCRASRITIANPGGYGDGAWAGSLVTTVGRPGYPGRTVGRRAQGGRVTAARRTELGRDQGRERARRLRMGRWPHDAEPSPPRADRTGSDRPG